jgi:hypothetical protein
MKLQVRISRLEKLLPPRMLVQDIQLNQRRWGKVVDRFGLLIEQALPLMTDSEQESVDQALNQILENCSSPYEGWLSNLREGRCRLPELKPEAMKVLLLAWLSPDDDSLSVVCNQCGLEYPHRWGPPGFFAACPGCGASSRDMNWSHLTDLTHRPWKEMDG